MVVSENQKLKSLDSHKWSAGSIHHPSVSTSWCPLSDMRQFWPGKMGGSNGLIPGNRNNEHARPRTNLPQPMVSWIWRDLCTIDASLLTSSTNESFRRLAPAAPPVAAILSPAAATRAPEFKRTDSKFRFTWSAMRKRLPKCQGGFPGYAKWRDQMGKDWLQYVVKNGCKQWYGICFLDFDRLTVWFRNVSACCHWYPDP